MKKFVNNWQIISIFLAVLTGILAIVGPWDFTQRIILALIVCLFLHFYEEFGFPGGFPYMGVKVLLGRDEQDPKKWDANNLNSIFGNWGFLILVYLLPLFLPGIRFLTLAAVIFAFLELFMHLILFNVKLRTFYNPGFVTAVFGMTPIAIYYFVHTSGQNLYHWYDYVLSFIWCIGVFFFCFRSPLYWKLGKKEGYPFTPQSAFGLELKNIKSASR
ncbi:HXXEE domain-containing protein [Corynebacterium sp. sy017]|uniref:HXXEE domain-containing protein n=1 Tax=unclassified Corynebacterium TaxID=2624378 RepID=UPI0011871048|nr:MULTISPECIES: HXXEE domain-containing protein [unclassified Corynebacterium]MBP3088384.1 HXXEE domain-containing protein [Corynebacterium sp. sy017]TSD91699.1 HXXEE domain-containing protein [Corynebacterium sp. SY003]